MGGSLGAYESEIEIYFETKFSYPKVLTGTLIQKGHFRVKNLKIIPSL